MNKKKYISWCKQEELTATLLAICAEIIVFGFVYPKVYPDDIYFLSILVMFAGVIATSIIFVLSNKGMMFCHKLMQNDGIIKKAVVENHRVSGNTISFYMVVNFRILDTGEEYVWKEQYCQPKGERFFHLQMDKYLMKHPEIEVIVDSNNHARHYILFEQIMLDPIRRMQKIFEIINVILGIILMIIFIIFLVKIHFNCVL